MYGNIDQPTVLEQIDPTEIKKFKETLGDLTKRVNALKEKYPIIDMNPFNISFLNITGNLLAPARTELVIIERDHDKDDTESQTIVHENYFTFIRKIEELEKYLTLLENNEVLARAEMSAQVGHYAELQVHADEVHDREGAIKAYIASLEAENQMTAATMA
jgi:hypothetical protein